MIVNKIVSPEAFKHDCNKDKVVEIYFYLKQYIFGFHLLDNKTDAIARQIFFKLHKKHQKQQKICKSIFYVDTFWTKFGQTE